MPQYFWFRNFVKEYDEEKIKTIASFINPRHTDKERIFIELHKTLSKLKCAESENLFVEHIYNKPIEYWHFSSRYGSDKEYINVKRITFDGQSFRFYEEGADDDYDYENMSFDSNVKGINGVALFKKEFYKLVKQWRQQMRTLTEHDKEIVFKARQLTARYEVLRKIL